MNAFHDLINVVVADLCLWRVFISTNNSSVSFNCAKGCGVLMAACGGGVRETGRVVASHRVSDIETLTAAIACTTNTLTRSQFEHILTDNGNSKPPSQRSISRENYSCCNATHYYSELALF